MRCLLVSHEYPPETADGGIGTQTWNKAHGLTKLGHSVEVLSWTNRPLQEPIGTAQESGITVHRMRPPGKGLGQALPIYDPAAYAVGYTWQVLQHVQTLAQRRRFDLVNFPEYGAEGFAYQVNRSAHNWLPVIVQLHAPLAMLAERMGWPDKNTSHYRTGCFLEGESIRLADGWMASSANIADFVAEFYEIPRDQITVVHCGVDCGVFRPALDVSLLGRRPVVLFMGNVAESKGVGTVLEAVARLKSSYPEILLRVVGKGDMLSQLQSLAKRLGVESNVEHVPYVKERDRVVQLFQEADVFASPADHENGVANVYVEAMACGCPVVAGNTGGAPEAVTDGQTGFLVPPRDVGAVTSALDRILSDTDTRRRMQKAARRAAVEYFDQERYIQRVMTAYQQAIARSHEKLQRLATESGL